jgi:hypothetical protein
MGALEAGGLLPNSFPDDSRARFARIVSTRPTRSAFLAEISRAKAASLHFKRPWPRRPGWRSRFGTRCMADAIDPDGTIHPSRSPTPAREARGS